MHETSHMRKHLNTLTTLLIGTVLISACSKKDQISTTNPTTTATADPLAALDLPATAFNYANIAVPAYYLGPEIIAQLNTPNNNPITDNGATLGRVLFYDKTLSANNTISCGSCHKPDLGFSDTAKLSKGFQGGLTGRNSMSIINARYYANGRFFWDERASTLEVQTLQPIQDHTEMGLTLDTLVNRLSRTTHYPVLFTNAFGNSTITPDRVSRALSQFVRSVVSYQSKYDVGRATLAPGQNPAVTPFANFTAQENQGKQIFLAPASCGACHGTETFVAPGSRNNGLDLIPTDNGVGAALGIANRNGEFKVTTLRNVEITAPYMHDGRFKTLEEVVEHYSSGVKNHPNLSPPLRAPNGAVVNRNFSEAEKAALVAFMKTLTDRTLATEAKYSNPFRNR